MANKLKRDSARRNWALILLGAGLKVVLVIVVAAAGYIGWKILRPEHFFNPINSFSHQQLLKCQAELSCPVVGTWSASMVPDVFALGEPREQVLRRIAEAGYFRHGDDSYLLMLAGSLGFFCGVDFYVSVTFDAAGGLTSALSEGGGVCL